MEILCALVVVLTVVTLVGHGLWLLTAAIGRAVAGPAEATPPAPRDRPRPCRNCGATLAPLRKYCPVCGMTRPAAAEMADLAVTLRTLAALHGRRQIDDDEYDRVRAAIDRRRQELGDDVPIVAAVVEPVPPPAPPPKPVVVPAPVPAVVAEPVPPPPPAVAPSPPLTPPPPPKAPRRSLAEWLAAFMEDRNILWGELVGGLLVVGCSVALVLSLWQTLERIPLFPFLALVGVTAALFGVGQYTLRQWRLEATSRGLLVIATLLVPLNFLVLAGLSPRSTTPWEYGVKLAAIPLFAWLVHRAAAVLFPTGEGDRPRRQPSDAALLTVAVLGAAVSPLAVPRLLDPADPSAVLLVLLAAWPVGCHALGVGLATARRWRMEGDPPAAARLLGFAGLTVFALALGLGFLVYWVAAQDGDATEALQRLSPLVALAGVPTLAAGLFVQQRLAGTQAERAGLLAATGTGAALAGGLVMLAGLACAWPEPWALIVVGLLDFAALTAVAVGFRLPPAHAVALACLTVAYAVGAQLAFGRPDDLAAALLSGTGGAALVGLATALAVAADRLRPTRWQTDAAYYAGGAGVVALLSLVLVTVPAPDEPARAAAVGGWTSVGCLVLGFRWRRVELLQAGSVLAVAATAAALHWLRPGEYALWGTVFAAEALAACAAAGPWWPAALLAAGLAVVGSLAGESALYSGWPTATAGLLAAAVFCRAGRERRAAWTWAGSALLPVGVAHFVLLRLDPTPPLPVVLTLLLHATLTVPAALVLRRRSDGVRTVFGDPLLRSGLVASLLAVPVGLLGIERPALGVLAADAVWLGLLWLAVAAAERRPGWFTAFEAAATAAVPFAVARWLDRTVIGPRPVDFTDPDSVRRFLLGLAALAVAWVAVRLAVRGRDWPRPLLEPPWPAFDRVLLGGLVLGQLALAVTGVVPGVLHELGPAVGGFGEGVSATFRQATDPAGWWVLAALTAALAGSLWDAGPPLRRAAALLGVLGIAVTVPVLAAGWFAPALATASALRWSLAAVFLLASLPFWGRDALARVAASVGIPTDLGTVDRRALRAALLAATAVPVVVLTLVTAALIFGGETPLGPAAGCMFADLGPLGSHGLPLAVVTVALVGHALRERSPADAFAGGLVANLIVTGGYALAVATAGRAFDDGVRVQLWQRFAVTAGVWALGWLAVGRGDRSRWWAVQCGLAVAGNFVVLGVAALLLAVPWAAEFPPPTDWTRAAAHWPGWLALAIALTVGAAPAARDRRRRPSGLFGRGGLGLVVLLACALADVGPAWGVRTLLAGGAALALLLAWPVGGRRPDFAPWVGITATLTAAIALKAAVAHADRPVAAAVLTIISGAVGILGLRRRADGWTFAAALGFHAAASLAVWHHFATEPLNTWLVPLLQANGLVAATVALVWHRFRGPRGLAGVPLAVAAGVQLVLLLPALPRLLLVPEAPQVGWVLQPGHPAAAVVLVATLLAWLAEADRRGPPWPSAAWGAGGLAAGVWLACAAAGWDDGTWLAYHALQAAWLVAAAVALAAGRASRAFWVTVFAGLAAALAVRAGWDDPLRPYAPALAALAAAGLVGGLAAVERWVGFVVASGLLLDLGCVLSWLAWGPATVPGFVATNVFGVATAAALWSFADRSLSAPARHPAAVGCVAVIAGLTLIGVLFPAVPVTGLPTWAAFGMTVLAVARAARDRAAPYVPQALYVVGLAGVGLSLLETGWTGEAFLRAAAVGLAGFVLLAQVLSGRAQELLARLGCLPPADDAAERTDHAAWFVPAQVAVGAVAVAPSAGVALAGGEPVQRLAGPLAAGLVVVAGVLLANRTAGRRGRELTVITLAVGTLAAAELGWAVLDRSAPALAARRTVAALAALAAGTVTCSFGLARLRAAGGRWAEAGRRTGPVLGLIGAAVVAAVVVQEGLLFDPVTKRTPLTAGPIALVAASLAGLIVAALAFAVRPEADPFRLTDRRRPVYVYAAEGLLVLLFLHLRFSVPGLFPPFRVQYWAFVVMAVAFVGVGLGELFRRHRLKVLAGPLQRTGVFLPLLPLLAFWLHPPEAIRVAVVGQFPGAEPLLKYLDRMPQRFDSYATLWFLVGSLYGVLAVTRRSYWYSLAAALAANVGLWALWHHGGVAFVAHPQLWLIPLALIVLASERHHRDRLAPEVAAGLRYLGLGALYVSSTADLFIAGLGNSAVLPVVLAVLAVLGVLAGILFRVRSYLYLGAGFLALDVLSMIWHAAVGRGQTWVWWASGVGLGLAILALFAVFEKRRPQVLAAVEEFRSWR